MILDGQIYIVTLLTDSESLRSIRSLDFKKCVNSVISTCLTKCYDEYIFVGSRLSNSILMKFSLSGAETEHNLIDKSCKFFIQNETKVSSNQSGHLFEISDQLLNIAPCGTSIIGESGGDISEFTNCEINSTIQLNNIDLVTTSGQTKNGAISILQRSLRPEIIASFRIQNILDIWSVNLCDSLDESNEFFVNYLFLTKKDSTIILEIANEITELDKDSCIFATNEPTLTVTNLNMNKYILQITNNKIYIYNKESVINIINIFDIKKLTSKVIKNVNVLEPFIGIIDESYKLFILKFDNKFQQIQIDLDSINCFNFFEDKTGVLTKIDNESLCIIKAEKKEVQYDPKESSIGMDSIDDEDEILYGNSAESKLTSTNDYINRLLTEKNPLNSNINNTIKNQTKKSTIESKKPSFKLFTVSREGSLKIYNLNNLNLEFTILNFNHASKIITFNNNYDSNKNVNAQVHEILIVCHNDDFSRPLIVARVEEDLLIYEINENLILKKLNHEIIIRDKKSKNCNQTKESSFEKPLLRKFDNLCNFYGFAAIGSSLSSYLVFYTKRSGLTPHPLWKDISFPITSFSQFTNSHISVSGFIYLNKNFDIRICTLPNNEFNNKTEMHYDVPWIIKKIQISKTVNFISYHEESKTYALCFKEELETNKLMQLGEEDKEKIEFQKDDNFIFPKKSQFYIQLYNSLHWNELPYGKYQLNEWEHVSCLKIVDLPYEGHTSGLRSYLVVSTIFCYSEDVNSRGRIILFDIIETVPEPDKPLTNTKLKMIYEKEQKGPVTCIDAVNAHLIGCVGQKIFIWEFKNNELIGKAFIDCSFYIHKMITLKNFILIADLHKSISLIRFQNEYTKLSFVAKVSHILI